MLEGYIILNILVTTKESDKLEMLGLNNEDSFIYKKHLIKVNSISSINLECKDYCVLHVDGGICETKETAEEIIELIKQSKIK